MLQAIKESKEAEGVGTYPRRRVPPAAEYAGRTILDTPHPRADASSFSGGFVSSELLQVRARQRLDSASMGRMGCTCSMSHSTTGTARTTGTAVQLYSVPVVRALDCTSSTTGTAVQLSCTTVPYLATAVARGRTHAAVSQRWLCHTFTCMALSSILRGMHART